MAPARAIFQTDPEAPHILHGLQAGRPSGMSERTWQVFLWRYVDRLSYVEIGRRLERTPKLVRDMCLRAERACAWRRRQHQAAQWRSGY